MPGSIKSDVPAFAEDCRKDTAIPHSDVPISIPSTDERITIDIDDFSTKTARFGYDTPSDSMVLTVFEYEAG